MIEILAYRPYVVDEETQSTNGFLPLKTTVICNTLEEVQAWEDKKRADIQKKHPESKVDVDLHTRTKKGE